jgi:hypothetical protein
METAKKSEDQAAAKISHNCGFWIKLTPFKAGVSFTCGAGSFPWAQRYGSRFPDDRLSLNVHGAKSASDVDWPER